MSLTGIEDPEYDECRYEHEENTKKRLGEEN